MQGRAGQRWWWRGTGTGLIVPTRRLRPRETGCRGALEAEVKEREGRREGREGGGTAESRIHRVQRPPSQHPEGVPSELLSLPSSPWGPSYLSQGV